MASFKKDLHESILLASSLQLNNLVLYVDNNNYQSSGKTSQTHPSFYPLTEKFKVSNGMLKSLWT